MGIIVEWKSWRHCLELGSGRGFHEKHEKFHELKWPAISKLMFPSLEGLLPSWIIPILYNRRSADHLGRCDLRSLMNQTVRSAVAACHFASPSSRWAEPTTCCNICGSMQCLCSLARAFLGAGWDGFGQMNHQQIEKRSIIYAYVFFYRCTPQ